MIPKKQQQYNILWSSSTSENEVVSLLHLSVICVHVHYYKNIETDMERIIGIPWKLELQNRIIGKKKKKHIWLRPKHSIQIAYAYICVFIRHSCWNSLQ